jgi:hypothetical protein
MFNPFAVREQATAVDPQRADTPVSEVPAYAVPQSVAYGVPSLEVGAPYNKEFGWAPDLRTSTTETPSAQRLGTIPRFDRYPDPQKPPQDSLYGRMDVDPSKRHSVESVDADGWTERKGVLASDRRWAPNPRSVPPAESRVTQSMAPTTYSFTRPFDQHSARQLNGMHFSMADHRREYEILGMAPVRTGRNTYRMEPVPWDVNIVDLPPDTSPDVPSARIRSTEVPAGSRSYRLGG